MVFIMSRVLSFHRYLRNKTTDFLLEQKERLFLWLPVVFACGIGFYFSLPEEPLITTGAAFFICSAFFLWDVKNKKELFFLALFVFSFFSGFFLIQTKTTLIDSAQIKFNIPRTDLTGTVKDVIETAHGRNQIVINDIKTSRLSDWQTPQNIRLNISSEMQSPQKEDVISAVVSLSPPPSSYTPSAFDIGRQLYFKKIGAVGKVQNLKIQKQSEKNFMRDKINRRIDAVLPESTRNIGKALITGNSKGVPFETYQNYRNAGIAHILSVSGLHMSLLAGIVFFVVRTVLSLIPCVSLRWNTKKIAALCALTICFFYLQISGMSYAAQRAFIMVALMLSAVLLNRRSLSVVSVAWAAFFVLLFSPESLISPGFQLSFSAVIALICVYETGIKKYVSLSEKKSNLVFYFLSGITAVVTASFIASLATAPFVIFHFGQIPVYSLLGNLLSSSLVGFLIMPSLALGTLLMPLGLDKFFLLSASFGIELINKTAAFISSLPHAVLSFPEMPVWGLLFAVFGGLWFCLWSGRIRLWGAVLFTAGLFSPLTTVSPDIYVRTRTAAFRNNEGLLEFRDGSSEFGAKMKWLSENQQNEELTKPCSYGFCLYEKNGFKIGLAYTRTGAYDACQRPDLDMLFLTVNFNEECSAKEKITKPEIEKAGTFTLTLLPEKIKIRTVLQEKGFRPWHPFYPKISFDWKSFILLSTRRIDAEIVDKF